MSAWHNMTGITVAPMKDGREAVAVTTPVLRAMMAVARERNYNRRIDHLDDLDPDGTHILSPVPTNEALENDLLPWGWHSMADGKPAKPQIRCDAWVKLRMKREAERGTIDVPYEFWPRHHYVVDGRRRLSVAPPPHGRAA